MSSFPAAEANCLFKPTAIYILLLYLERKSMNIFRMKLKFLWPGPADHGPLANASYDHSELHSCSVVQIHALHSCGWAHSQWCCHLSFYAVHFHGSLVYALCLLSIIHCTVHNNYFGSSFQFQLFLPFVRGLGAIFFFLIKGLCLWYQVLNEDFIAHTIIITVPINSTNWYLQLSHSAIVICQQNNSTVSA